MLNNLKDKKKVDKVLLLTLILGLMLFICCSLKKINDFPELYTSTKRDLISIESDGQIVKVDTDDLNEPILEVFNNVKKGVNPNHFGVGHGAEIVEWYPNQPNDRHEASGGGRCHHGNAGGRCNRHGSCRDDVACPDGTFPIAWPGGKCTCFYLRNSRGSEWYHQQSINIT